MFIILFILGLAAGSFLNVVALRFKPEGRFFDFKNIRGRSACPHCQKTLRWYELIPLVSFLIQAGKCRSCGHRLSWQYPIVELLSGLIFITVPLLLQTSSFKLQASSIWFSLIWILAFLVLLLISVIDFRHFFIPDELIWLLGFLGLAFILFKLSAFGGSASGGQVFPQSFLRHYALIFSWSNNIWLNHLLGALIAGAFFGLLVYLSRGKIMGRGDAKLALAIGWLLGWPDTMMALILTFLLGGAVGLILVATGKKLMKDYLPFAPFFAAGASLTIFFGYQIINSYFGLFGL